MKVIPETRRAHYIR